YHPFFASLKRALESKELGRPLAINVTYGYSLTKARKHIDYREGYAADPKKGGGVLMDSGSHVIDYLSSLFGAVASARAEVSHQRNLAITSEDFAKLYLTFDPHLSAEISLSYLLDPAKHVVEITFEKGTGVWDVNAFTFTKKDSAGE